MSNFKEFRSAIQQKFEAMTKNVSVLYETNVDKDEMWNLYLDSFPAEANPIYRERREHDCSCCRHFVKSIGHVVAIENGKITSIWDIQVNDPAYQVVADAMSAYVKSKPVSDIYHVVDNAVGTNYNYETVESGPSLGSFLSPHSRKIH